MKAAGMLIILIGFVLILVFSIVKPGGNPVYNWSPVNGMIIMGIGAMVYIASGKIRTSEMFQYQKDEKQFGL